MGNLMWKRLQMPHLRLSLVIGEAKNNGRKALAVLRVHYQGKGEPRIIVLYTELTLQKKGESKTMTDYIIRAETAATALRAAKGVMGDGSQWHSKAYQAVIKCSPQL